MADKIERVYTIPLRKAYYTHVRTKRTVRAVKLLREFIARHMKVPAFGVKLSAGLNSLLWRSGIQKPPRKVKVKIVREGEVATASLIDEKPAKVYLGKAARGEAKRKAAPKKEAVKPEAKKEAPKPAQKKEEPKKAEAPAAKK